MAGCSNDLGMESRKIKKSQLSSKTSDKGWEADRGRLRNSKAWCSETEDVMFEYFQIDLLRVRRVSAIATQGVHVKISFLKFDYYVETYMIKYSFDGATWFYYQAEDGANVVSDSISLELNVLLPSFHTFNIIAPFLCCNSSNVNGGSSRFWQVIDCYSILL